MLQRQAAWVPVLSHCPQFADACARFLRGNPYTTRTVALAALQPASVYVARHVTSAVAAATTTVATSSPTSVCNATDGTAVLMAFPLTLSVAACDTSSSVLSSSTTTTTQQQHVHADTHTASVGYLTALFDCCSSVHVMQRLLPHMPLHVSVNLQTHMLRPLRAGERAVLVSRIDKLGKRLAYCTAHLLIDDHDNDDNDNKDDGHRRDVAARDARERQAHTLTQLHDALAHYECVAHFTHTKSILLRE